MKNKKLCVKLSIGMLIVVLFSIQAFSRVIANRGEVVFEEQRTESATLDQMIVEGAGYYLDSYSQVLTLMNKVELVDVQGIDYVELQQIVDRALTQMEKARNRYSGLKVKSNATPYRWGKVEKLVHFNYTGFEKAKGLNGSIMSELKGHLGKGDVRSIFGRLHKGCDNILTQLQSLKNSVDAGEFPVLADIWKLNQDYSSNLLFGQYAAQIFYEISEN